MNLWPKSPLIYEINTWVWLTELRRGSHDQTTLASVPDQQWDAVAEAGFSAVWLMGVWERSPESVRISMQNRSQLEDFKRALPDFTEADNVGSPYSVRRYVVDSYLGGPEGLAVARRKLADRGVRLILDFVPNHVAIDHPWVTERPEYFIHGTSGDLLRAPEYFTAAGSSVIACGRDPYFPPWRDVLQLNAFEGKMRSSALETLLEIAEQCDAVRCDMAMLVMNHIFEQTWGPRAGVRPPTDYWPDIIPAVKKAYPEFKFIAESYWDLEWSLQQQGFDYCYDKRLYDRLEDGPAEYVGLHLCADLAYQEKLVRFIENHDETRAAQAFHPARHRAAAVVIGALPGARLIHEGQLEGRKVRLPVFLARRPPEPVDKEISDFYTELLHALRMEKSFKGTWRLCERTGWPDNTTYRNLAAWCWTENESRTLVVVNLSGAQSQGRVKLPWNDIAGSRWLLQSVMGGESFTREGDEMPDPGLYVDLGPWEYHFFNCLKA